MKTAILNQTGLPEGFTYIPEFLTEIEEKTLLEGICEIELHPLIFQGFKAKRKVRSFGYDYNFNSRSVSPGEPIPPLFRPAIEKAAEALSLMAGDFAELLITEYPAGSVINWHRDAPPFDLVAGISLLSDCRFRLRPYDKKKQNKSSVLSVPVERRSLYVLSGTARSDWEHSISPVKERRYSLTLRTLRTKSKMA